MAKPLAQILRSARQTKGMTQEQLAAQLYVTRQTISSWEKGRTQPDLETLRKICTALDLSSEELLLGNTHSDDQCSALIRASTFCFWAMTILCLALGILSAILHSPTCGFYNGFLFLCQVTIYPILSYMVRHHDYSLLAGYDANAAYDFPSLHHMVALLHAALASTGLLMSIFGIILFFIPFCVPWLVLVYVINLCGSFLIIQTKYGEQIYLPNSRDQILARMLRWSTLLGILMLLTGAIWGVTLCILSDPQTLNIGPFLLSLFGQQACGGLLLFSQQRTARRAVDKGQETCTFTRTSRMSLVLYILLFLWMTLSLL